MTQEQLAASARLDRRTIQRLEKGQPASTETLHQVAASLGVVAAELCLEPNQTEETPGIILKPEVSGRRLVEAIVQADQIDFGIAFEPWPRQLAIVRPLLRFLEELHPLTFEQVGDYDHSLGNSAAARLEAAAKVNEDLAQLRELQPEGLHPLFGQYSIMGKRVRWDPDEGCWYTSLKQREEVLTVSALRLAPMSVSSLRVPIQGKPVSPEPLNSSWDELDTPF
jgi:transcriptional regulator with XRE-family HTH domain